MGNLIRRAQHSGLPLKSKSTRSPFDSQRWRQGAVFKNADMGRHFSAIAGASGFVLTKGQVEKSFRKFS